MGTELLAKGYCFTQAEGASNAVRSRKPKEWFAHTNRSQVAKAMEDLDNLRLMLEADDKATGGGGRQGP